MCQRLPGSAPPLAGLHRRIPPSHLTTTHPLCSHMPASLLSRAAAASSLSAAAAARPASSRIAAVASHLRMSSSSSAAPPASGSPPPKMPSFDLSPVPKNPLGEGNYVTSAG